MLEKQLLTIVAVIKKMQLKLKKNNISIEELSKLVESLKEFDNTDNEQMFEELVKTINSLQTAIDDNREEYYLTSASYQDKLKELTTSLELSLDSIKDGLKDFITIENINKIENELTNKIKSIKIEPQKEIEIGKVETLDPGEEAKVEVTKTKDSYKLDFYIPRGVSGRGMPGKGVPSGGTTNQVLAKNSNDDYDTKWVSGGGGGTSDHSELTNLDYASAGHTGFQPSGDYALNSDIPTKTSELTNDSGFITTPYTLPTASTTTLGGVKIDGSTINITDGVISAVTGGSGTVTSVAITGSDGIEVDSGSPITSSGTIALGVNKATMLSTLNVADGAEVNVQADWNQANNTADDYIKNKPTIPTVITDHTALSNIGTNSHANIDTKLASLENDRTILKEPTGFLEPENVIITYNSTTQKVTLTGTITAYYRGTNISIANPTFTSGWVSSAHTNSPGVYFLYYDGTNFVWGTNFPDFGVLQIAIINYRAVNPFGSRECHGFLPWQSHKIDHYNIGTYRSAGGDITNIVPASTTADNRRPIISECTINDEDCVTINPALTSKKYTQRYLSSADTINYTLQANDIVPLSTNNPYYNSFTTPNFGQTLMPANSVMTVWLYEVPVTADSASQEIRHVFVQGQSITQATNSSAGALVIARNTERLKTPLELNLGVPSVVAAEYVCIHKFIIQYTSSNWSITDSIVITGSRANQVGSPSGNYLSLVTTDTTLTGNGTVATPLSVANPVTPQATGFTISAGTTPKTLTVSDTASVSGTNTGNQTSIVGISGTKAQFDTACSDGNFLYSGDITQYTDEMAQDAVGGILTDTTTIDFTYTDASNKIEADVKNASITYAKIQNVSATDRILGRDSAGAGSIEEITPANLVTMLKSSLVDLVYPVGSIYETTSTDLDTTTKMGTYFGGTWEEYGSGRVLVAKSADTEFDVIGETGGAKTNTLSESNLPYNTVMGNGPSVSNSWAAGIWNNYTGAYSTNVRGNLGTSGSAFSVLQPYIVVYRYRRTA